MNDRNAFARWSLIAGNVTARGLRRLGAARAELRTGARIAAAARLAQ